MFAQDHILPPHLGLGQPLKLSNLDLFQLGGGVPSEPPKALTELLKGPGSHSSHSSPQLPRFLTLCPLVSPLGKKHLALRTFPFCPQLQPLSKNALLRVLRVYKSCHSSQNRRRRGEVRVACSLCPLGPSPSRTRTRTGSLYPNLNTEPPATIKDYSCLLLE